MVLQDLFTWRMNLYRLIAGAIVLAIVIPSWEVGIQPMWIVVVGCILIVVAAVIIGSRVASVRNWLRH